jgi:putative addiction module component (TIGR02574 family)
MLTNSLSQLGYQEKLQLVWELWDSLAEDTSHMPLSEEDKTELLRRYAEYERTGEKGDTWENVKARILGK